MFRMIHTLKQFIGCHTGTINRVLHVIGILFVVTGLFEKSLFFVIAGAVIQESGHFYQYARTKKFKDSPLHCLKPQLIFAYPLLLAAILFVVLTK